MSGIIRITEARMRLAEHERNIWVANAPEGSTVEHIKQPEFWAYMAHLLHPFDQIEVRADDGSWMAELVVVNCDRTWAKVFVKHVYELTTTEEDFPLSVKHKIVWRGPQHKFSVERISDQQRVKSGFSTKDEAGAWLREHERAL